MHTSVAVHPIVVDLLAVVGKVDEEHIAAAEVAHDVGHDAVVVARGIVVVRNDLPLQGVQVRTVVVVGLEEGKFGRIAPIVFHVLPPKVEQIEIAAPRGVVFEQLGDAPVVATAEGVAEIEAKAVEMRVVEKERTVEVDRTLRNTLVKLVGDESHLEAGAPKEERKEHPVRPCARRVGTVGRKEGLEGIAGEVPRRDHVVKHRQLALSAQPVELRRGALPIAVKAGVVFVVTLADHHHNVGRARCDAVHACRVHHGFEAFDLAARHAHQVSGVEQAIVGSEEVDFRHFLGVATLRVGDKVPKGLFFTPPMRHPDEQQSAHRRRSTPLQRERARVDISVGRVAVVFARLVTTLSPPRREASPSAARHCQMSSQNRQIDGHRLPKRIAAHHPREKFARLVGRSFAQQREHRGRKQEVEAQKEKHLDRRQPIGHGKHNDLHPSGETAREVVDEQREEIEIDHPAKEVMPHLVVRPMHHQHRSGGQ